MKKLITQNAVASLMTGVFQLLGIDKAIAAEVIKDPVVRKEMQKLKQSMETIANAGERLKKIRSHNNVF